MPRVVGIDPGTVSLDLCGLDDGRLVLDRSFPTADALASPARLIRLLEDAGPLDLIVGPSGCGLPYARLRDVSESDLRLAVLAPRGETGGLGGLGALMRALAASSLPVVVIPGVVHLGSVPEHRKINRIDIGTADKVCAVALAIQQRATAHQCLPRQVSFILLELGGAFSAAIAVAEGQIVDGLGGSSGPIGVRACGALDAEVAFLAGRVTKDTIFSGGALDVAGTTRLEALAAPQTPRARVAWDGYLEGMVKAVAALSVSVPGVREVLLSGRLAGVDGVRGALADRVRKVLPEAGVEILSGFAAIAKHAAQGAAILADGLAGGSAAALVDRLGVRDARGSVLDHLHVVSPEAARRRLGIEP